MENNVETLEKVDVLKTLFTESELAELEAKGLGFSDEEREAFEAAEAACEFVDYFKDEKDMDEFYTKYGKEFPLGMEPDAFMAKYVELAKKDPEFVKKIFGVSALLDEVHEVPPPTTEKLSVSEIMAEVGKMSNEEQAKKFAEIDEVLRSMK